MLSTIISLSLAIQLLFGDSILMMNSSINRLKRCSNIDLNAYSDKNHAVILLLEGLIESIPEVFALLQEIHSLLQEGVSADNISAKLSPSASALFEFMPPFIRKQLSNPERYGSLLTLDELKEFDMLNDNYEIIWHLNHLRSVINPTYEDLKSRSAKVKNVDAHSYQSGRRMSRHGEKWSETLLRRAEKALLMERIRMEQQRLGVDEMDWVGNDRREEEQDGLILLKMLSEYIDVNTVLPALSSKV
ncbi:coiled-coil domain-containing protein 97, partial [Tanacetum coccineum]